MNTLYLGGGLFVLFFVFVGFFVERWTKRSTVAALACAVVFIVAGIENSASIALFGSVLFVLWTFIHIPERLHKIRR